MIKGEKYSEYEALSVHGDNWENKIYLYCFNVGQGDTFLFIPSSGNPYLIDTNFYSEEHIEAFADQVRDILIYHGLPENTGAPVF